MSEFLPVEQVMKSDMLRDYFTTNPKKVDPRSTTYMYYVDTLFRKAQSIYKFTGMPDTWDYDYFTTTLTISPLKNANWLNEIGRLEGEKEGVLFLPSDFKKKDGYKRSIQLSKKFDLYRQDFCGCSFSKAEMELRRAEQKENEL